MVAIYPFAAVRPEPTFAQDIASVPYDVVTTEEARKLIKANPLSFLRISRADAELPFEFHLDERVYRRAKENFEELRDKQIMIQDTNPSFYVYRVNSGENVFTGLVACVDVGDYTSGRIRQHELTQYEKERDRTNHIDIVNAQTGLIFLVYRDEHNLKETVESLIPNVASQCCEVKMKDGSQHQIYQVMDYSTIEGLRLQFSKVTELYIADGHHRAAAAVNVAKKRAVSDPTNLEPMRIMAVLFAHNQVMIHGYSRLISDLGNYTASAFLNRLTEEFTVKPCSAPPNNGKEAIDHNMHLIFMYLENQWYKITRQMDNPQNILASFDVVVLQDWILRPILGISDPRQNSRLHYYGGIHPVKELEDLVRSGRYAVAFALRPLSINAVMDIADNKEILPPKSTWFEPKLLSGLLVHNLD